MAAFNFTPSDLSPFILNGIPDLEAAYVWISIPFTTVYIFSLLGNVIVISVVSKEQILHKPMYLLLSMLALTDISLSTTIAANALCFVWFHLKKLTVDGCLTRIFFVSAIGAMHSAILVTMAFDRYIAICDPLRYTTILTNARIAKLGLVGLVRALLLVFPLFFFREKLSSCASQVIPNIYCEYITLVQKSCGNTTVNWIHILVVPLVTIISDLTIIVFSYVLIFRTVLRISSKKAYQKALNTCTTHIILILMFYTPSIFTILTQSFDNSIPDYIHMLLTNLYVLVPTVLNPIIYGIRSKELSQKLGKYICRMWSLLPTDFKYA